MVENRRQYVARVPSSSLLGIEWFAQPSPDIPQYGIVNQATLMVKELEEKEFIKHLHNKITNLPKNVSWFVAKACDDNLTWILLQTSYLKPSTPDANFKILSSDSTIDSTEKSVEDFEEEQSVMSVRRQASGAAQPYFGSNSAEEYLIKFLSVVSSLLSEPPTLQHAWVVVPSFHLKLDLWFIKQDIEVRTSLITLRETLCIKPEFQKHFVTSCLKFQKNLSTKLDYENVFVMELEVHQDLEASVDGCVFTIFYYFENDMDTKLFYNSHSWKLWREDISKIIEGSSKLIKFRGVFDTREYPKTFDAEIKVQTPQTVCTPTDTKTSSDSIYSACNRIDNLHQIHLVSQKSKTSKESKLEGTPTVEKLNLISYDSRLSGFTDFLHKLKEKYNEIKQELLNVPLNGSTTTCLTDLKNAHMYFGIQRISKEQWCIREWLPGIKQASVIGDFNAWEADETTMIKEDESKFGPNVFVAHINATKLHHCSKLKLRIVNENDETFDRIPPCTSLVWKELDSEIRDAIAWDSVYSEEFTFQNPHITVPKHPKIYEAYVGLTPAENRFGTYLEFTKKVLPRIKKLGYNTLLLLGIPEHSLTSLGWHVNNFFVITSQFGTITEFKQLVDTAHGLGISVMMSIIHSHAGPVEHHGLYRFNGTDDHYTADGPSGKHRVWDAVIFDYKKPQVHRFLLTQLARFIYQFKIDGFRFEGVSSMLYHHHCIGKDFSVNEDLSQYFTYETDIEALAYLSIANEFLHSLGDVSVATIASESTSFPLLCYKVELGGLGFDFCCSARAANMWIKQLSNSIDTDWSIENICSVLESVPKHQKNIAFAENWNTVTRSRRPLLIALFAWESLYTHAVGGVAPHVTELAAGLARLGHEVHVYVRATGESNSHNVHYGVHYHECPFRLDRDFVAEMNNMCHSFIWHMSETEAFLKRKFDICHAHDWLATRALILAKQSGHTCVQSIHSTEFGRCGNKSYGGESRRIADLEREGAHIADRIICVSGVLANEVSNLYGINSKKIAVIYNGINALNFDGFEDAAPIKAQYGIPPMDPMFLFVGRLATQKGPDILVEAIPSILRFRDNTKFVFVGDGYSKNDLINRTRQLRIDGSCRFLGTQTGATLKSLFKACDAVVVPSRNEPFGIVVLEAWSAYKPVVATTCGGPRDFVTPNVDGILVDPAPNSIAWGCCEILKNFDHARWMGQRGRVKAAFNFSWDETSKRTERIYWEQLNKHDSPYAETGTAGDSSLAFRLAGATMYHHMGIFDDNEEIHRCLALHKIIRLVTSALGGQGYLNFMGNEFGQPDYVDVPREGNQKSYTHTNRRYDLADERGLKFKHFEFFDACMIRLENALQWISAENQYVRIKDETNKILAFERGNCLFVVNFHPTNSYEGYTLPHAIGSQLSVVFDTDEKRFGGFGRVEPAHETVFPDLFESQEDSYSQLNEVRLIKLYIPSRTAMILTSGFVCKSQLDKFVINDPVLSCKDADEYISLCL